MKPESQDPMTQTNHPIATKLADHIIFIGFMGSGKSSVARKLARFERMNSIDMDAYLEREAGMSVRRIFEVEGEEGFRAREFEFLRSMLVRDRSILSCGGGVVVCDASRELLRQLGTVIYLVVDVDEAISRISRPETRPLLSGTIPPAELLASRLRYYEDTADIIVDTRGRSINQVVSAVQCVLRAGEAVI
jgi:shikimate kinase